MPVYEKIAREIPRLDLKLKQAGIDDSPEEYIRKRVFLSGMLGFGLCIIAFLFLQSLWVFLAFPIASVLMFVYFVGYVDTRIRKLEKEINEEIVYAVRFLIIELESGLPIYHAFQNVAKNYDQVGTYFEDIVREVSFGTSLEDALNKHIERTPSADLRKILWQVLNSLKTGADVKSSLRSALNQIVRKQQITVKQYGRKLNPLAMFYMMVAIIVPSLGTTILVVIATFAGFSLSLLILMIVVGLVGFIQMMFFAYIKTTRPPMATGG